LQTPIFFDIECSMARPSYPSDDVEKLLLRFPQGMRDQIKAAADTNGRSMNAEIITRLQAGLDQSPVDSVPGSSVELRHLDAFLQKMEERSGRRASETLENYRTIVAKQDALLQAICYRVLQFKDAAPPDAFLLAEKLLASSELQRDKKLGDDPETMVERYNDAIRSATAASGTAQKKETFGTITAAAIAKLDHVLDDVVNEVRRAMEDGDISATEKPAVHSRIAKAQRDLAALDAMMVGNR